MFSWFSQWNKFGNRWMIDEITAYKNCTSFWTTLCSAEERISHRWCNALLYRRPGMSSSWLTFCLVIVLSNLGLFSKCFQKEKQSKANKSLNAYRLCNNDITKPRNGIINIINKIIVTLNRGVQYCGIEVRRGLYGGGWTGCIANPLHSSYLTRGLRSSHSPRSC